jgi:hypothetical protein
MLTSAMMDTGDRESSVQNKQDLTHMSTIAFEETSLGLNMTYPSKHSKVIISAESLLDVSSAVNAQSDRNSRQHEKQQVNCENLYTASCRFQSHAGFPLNRFPLMQVNLVSTL